MGKKRRAKDAQRLWALAADMEEPLNDAIALVRALRLTGDAMIAEANPECGEPVVAVARVAAERLADLSQVWAAICEAAASARAAT
ncbi:MAG TPA: hypothetical protein VG889_03760 [Rhizomicrobium sp.]|nr:hypothetical protein [Rhizomicrobium sp.]